MKPFMDKDFILDTPTAQHLYHDYASKMPLADYHCHLNPQEIFEDRRFNNLAEVWLGGENPDGTFAGDHYKWRVMRSNGVEEKFVTGMVDPFEKFMKFVEALEMAIGNPMYHWCHLELRQFFGVTEPLTTESAKRIWDHCNNLLQNDPDMSARGLIRKANVAFIGTTDDPIDSLEWHEKIAADPTIEVVVGPSYRPDKAVNIHKAGWHEYMKALAKSVGKEELATMQDVLDALLERLAHFKAHGCKASDHGLDYVPFVDYTVEQADAVYQKALKGEKLTIEEIEGFQTVILLTLGKAYHEMDIAMQLHYSCLRNNNQRIFKLQGGDTGVDAIAQNTCGGNISQLLSALDEAGKCPKTILYSLNPADNAQLGTLIGCFQGPEVPGKIQQGSAWWFNDHKVGMEEQMKSLASLGLLGNFVGMLTDSRSFLSYARHDYFRRIMCNLIGNWVENGEYPNIESSLKKLVEGISFNNAKRYFGL
ncbi:MAG: glucuronate isomerase [Oscillospiraceae bacterium]|nr:glucuronate isomerase [Oscillospiraceae bacterium]MBQ7130435.1 glucuronate isomerase [Oscillospiraceae bacterium]